MGTRGRVRGQSREWGSFSGGQSHSGLPPGQAPRAPPKRSPARSGPTSPPHSRENREEIAQVSRELREGLYMGGQCLFNVIALTPAGKRRQISGAHHRKTGGGSQLCSPGSVAPPFPCLAQVTPSRWCPRAGSPGGPKRGPIRGAKNGRFSPHISGHGCGAGMPPLVRLGPVCPHTVLKGRVPAPQAEWSSGGASANPNPVSGGLGLAHAP